MSLYLFIFLHLPSHTCILLFRQEITKNSTFFLIADDTLDAVYAYNLYPNDNGGIILDPKLTGLTQPRYKPACTSYYDMDANGNSQLRIMVAGKGTIQPDLGLVPSENFFFALNRSHHFLLTKSELNSPVQVV